MNDAAVAIIRDGRPECIRLPSLPRRQAEMRKVTLPECPFEECELIPQDVDVSDLGVEIIVSTRSLIELDALF
jgi:hypothetical protein